MPSLKVGQSDEATDALVGLGADIEQRQGTAKEWVPRIGDRDALLLGLNQRRRS
jgi:hypothetical protein